MSEITDRLEILEQQSSALEPSNSQRSKWMDKVQDYADQFIDGMDERPAFNNKYDTANLFSHDSFDKAISMDEAVSFIKSEVDQYGLNPASGGHVGYIPGGGIFPTAMGDFIAAVNNRYAGIFFGSPGAVRMENALIQWMNEIIGFPKDAHGNLCSGGSIANLIAITTARDKKNIKSAEVDKSVVYLTEQTHHCVQKAIRIAGLRECIHRYIPMDTEFKMDAEYLRKQIEQDIKLGLNPFIIVGSAGTTDTGSIDPLEDIADLASKYDVWFHVDAAYGGFFILVDDLKSKFKGIEKADSVAIDPHKGLFLSYGLGVILIKDVKAMYESHFYKAAYMQDAQGRFDELSPADLSPELTKHYRGMRLWLSLKLLSLAPFKAALEEKHLLAKYFYQEIQKLGFEVGPEPELSVLIYRYVKTDEDVNEFNKHLMKEIHDDGRVFLSSTSLNGDEWIRAAILSFRTHKSTMDTCLLMIKDCVERTKNYFEATS